MDKGFARLDELCTDIVDCPHSTPPWLPEGKIVLRNFNIKNGQIDLSEPSYTDVKTFDSRNRRVRPKTGDIVISREAPMGEAAMIPNDFDICLGQRMVLLRPNLERCDGRYLLYALLSDVVQQQIKRHDISGSIVSNLCIPDLCALQIPMRSIGEQRKVGSFLATIDAKIANNKKLMAELDATARLMYDYWFTQFDFPDENGNPYRSSGGKTVWSNELKHDIPANWEIGSLEDIATLASGATPSTSEPSNYSTKGIAWITPDDLSGAMGGMFIGHGKRDVSLSGLQSCSATLLPKGSVILSSRAPIGYLAIALGNCCTNQGCKSFIPDKGYGSYFIFFMLGRMMPLIKSQGAGTTFKEVSKDTLSKLRVLLPPKPVVTLFEQTIEGICGEMRSLQAEAESLANLRDWLLPMLMNGQAQVTD